MQEPVTRASTPPATVIVGPFTAAQYHLHRNWLLSRLRTQRHDHAV